MLNYVGEMHACLCVLNSTCVYKMMQSDIVFKGMPLIEL